MVLCLFLKIPEVDQMSESLVVDKLSDLDFFFCFSVLCRVVSCCLVLFGFVLFGVVFCFAGRTVVPNRVFLYTNILVHALF